MEAAVDKELEEVTMELEQMKAEYKKKTELHLRLKRAHDDQIIKLQEAKLQMEKQSQEICAKAVEICEAQRVCEELKSSLAQKDLIVRELSCANEKLRAGREDKFELLEGANRRLVWSLDDLTAQKEELEDKLRVTNEESEGLKAVLSATEKKCFELENKARMSKELSCKDGLIERLEDESRNVQVRLKWKNEQFDHLEEAHEKLHGEFHSSKLEWEKERLVLLDKVSYLQSSLDSQTRMSNSLQTKLTMCQQALAHEESRRKLIEVQLSESQALFENIYGKCQEEQSKIDQLTAQRDEEIANLREQLNKKDVLFKEMEFKILELKQQKEDTAGSLQEFQEAEIKHAGSKTSLTKLQKKLQNLEQVHGSCLGIQELKETEWTSQLERLTLEVKEYLSELKNKEKQIRELHKELEMCQFSLQILNEEMAVVVMILKSEYSEAYSKLLDQHENKRDRELSYPIVESKSVDLEVQNQTLLLKTDLEDHKNMLEESQRKQVQLEEDILEIEKLNKAEMAERSRECNFINAELQKWKNDAEILKSSLEEAQEIHKKMVAVLKLQLENEQASKREISNLRNVVKEQGSIINALEQEANSLDASIAVKDEMDQNQILLLTMDLEDHKIMLKESQRQEHQLDEHVAEIEMAKAELQKWKNDAEISKASLEEVQEVLKQTIENEQASKQEINNLKNVIKELETNAGALQKQVTYLETAMSVKDDSLKALELENKNCIGIIEELESENLHLNKMILGLVTDRETILVEMEGASNHLGEICCQSESFLRRFRNSDGVINEHKFSSSHDRKNGPIPLSPTASKFQTGTNERLPFHELNY
uniref:Uncharacterized protein n=1 Tax=Kalanchoe fedtschenkoi TaxID=63787 RepID=A0A7N0T4E8_KALFE